MLILASASPRRHELLLAAGIDHVVRPSSIEEQRHPDELPAAFVVRMAKEKAGAALCGDQDTVLGADTVVCVEDEVLGKPLNGTDARRMLRLLSGRDHWVHTGICIRTRQHSLTDLASTRVTFLLLSDLEIEEYVATGEPYDKAGAYAIQGRASRFVSCIVGCYSNVVGLPVSLVYEHLKRIRQLRVNSSSTREYERTS